MGRDSLLFLASFVLLPKLINSLFFLSALPEGRVGWWLMAETNSNSMTTMQRKKNEEIE